MLVSAAQSLMRPLSGRILPLAAALCAIACSQQSALGNGTFSYECVATSAVPCASGSQAIPASMPLGQHFKVTYKANDTTAYPNVTVLPVSADFIGVEDGVWVALRGGSSGVYATAGGLALDYTFVRVDVADAGGQ